MIERITIEPNPHQPRIILEPTGDLLFEGRTIVANAIEFYEPIIDWLISFQKEGGTSIKADFKYDYVNTASHKMLIQLFLTLKDIEKLGVSIVVNWYYFEDDEDILEFGEEADLLTGVKFNLIKRYN